MLDIQLIRQYNKPECLVVTEHARKRLIEREISISDIVAVIDNGEIIRQYEDDSPFPSCLVLGLTVEGRCLHVVVSYDNGFVYIITAYVPSKNIWNEDLKTKK